MTLQQARKQYKEGKITYKELDNLFWDLATDYEKEGFYHTPLFDRDKYVEGKSQAEMDAAFNKLWDSTH